MNRIDKLMEEYNSTKKELDMTIDELKDSLRDTFYEYEMYKFSDFDESIESYREFLEVFFAAIEDEIKEELSKNMIH